MAERRPRKKAAKAAPPSPVDASPAPARMRGPGLSPGASSPGRICRCALESCGRTFTFDPDRPVAETGFPFCSLRCKGADLGAWVNEEYRVETPLGPDDLDHLEELAAREQRSVSDPRTRLDEDEEEDDDAGRAVSGDAEDVDSEDGAGGGLAGRRRARRPRRDLTDDRDS